MTELQHSLHSMGVFQYLLAVTFLICYALALGDFLGPGARFSVASIGFMSAVGFSALANYWVHGVLLTAFVVVGMGLFIGTAWLLKTLVSLWQRHRRALREAAHPTVDAMPGEDAASAYRLSGEHRAIDHAHG